MGRLALSSCILWTMSVDPAHDTSASCDGGIDRNGAEDGGRDDDDDDADENDDAAEEWDDDGWAKGGT